MDHVAFTTDNIVALRRYFTDKGIKASQIQGRSDHSLSFVVKDPEGHLIEFVERGKAEAVTPAAPPVSRHMIHAGFLVHNRDAETTFTATFLALHLYWQGGMQPDKTDWVAMQVPDGTDWLEYMLNQPEHPDLRGTGVMNHISLGVVDMKKAQAILESHGWKAHGTKRRRWAKTGSGNLTCTIPI